ncbi:adenylyl-sulfate kinase [Tannockella kyphosi]|uniref:adenylyl-sulfate kinase n=1 Tax=Tannockella kyphosi TaxID=2899121 RepID=UPI0020135D19|nr:adenylyl-sulfate kinase [Tannockella kyphosi]
MAQKDILKFITCGSVDDGKSTLIGHMLYDAKMIFTDQQQAIELASKISSENEDIDYSLLLDGLMVEREQGITIDVAYRYFATEKRNFIVADCPGHEQYTRNMAVGASFADLAIILIDASRGVLPQTLRHINICNLMGIKHFILAANKMDLIAYDQERFEMIVRDFTQHCANLEVETIHAIPVSATKGDNITKRSKNTIWYKGKTLFEYLETVVIHDQGANDTFLLPVQRVCRPDNTFRGYQGQLEAGNLTVGQNITIYPNRNHATVNRILIGSKDVDSALKGQGVTVCLDKEIDIARGDIISNNTKLITTDLLKAKILWMDHHELGVGQNYLFKCGTKLIPATIMSINHCIDLQTGKFLSARKVFMNDIAEVTIMLNNQITLDLFSKTESIGSFILIDRISHQTSACGTIIKELKRTDNIIWQDIDITREVRSNQKHQEPLTIWLTGLSGAGKTTVANALEKHLIAMGKHTILLDGDNLRHGLNKDLSFDESDRVENIRRVFEVAKLMNDAGLIVITSLISPYKKDRQKARKAIGDCFHEVYLSTSIEECERRDVKGLYQKARLNEITNFTGIQNPYEIPTNPEFEFDTEIISANDIAIEIIDKLIVKKE